MFAIRLKKVAAEEEEVVEKTKRLLVHHIVIVLHWSVLREVCILERSPDINKKKKKKPECWFQ